jgi:DNA modification methylase
MADEPNGMSLIRADARQIPLVDGCVQTVITSPPYWGLRDYGTATWQGGDVECDHFKLAGGTAAQGLGKSVAAMAANVERASVPFRDECGKCGAQRIDSQIGLEPTPDAYVQSLVQVFREVWRVLKDDGTCWLNLGDSYAHSLRQSGSEHAGQKQNTNSGSMRSGFKPLSLGLKEKDLVGIPWRVAFALQADGWYLRSDIIWAKSNPMPESVTDRPTKSHEYLFLLTKAERYYYDAAAIAEAAVRAGDFNNATDQHHEYAISRVIQVGETRNKRSVWHVATQPYSGAHFATWPEKLIEPCILAGSRAGDLVLDPFCGSGTTLAVAERFGRRAVGTDLGYQDLAKQRTLQRGLRFIDEASA